MREAAEAPQHSPLPLINKELLNLSFAELIIRFLIFQVYLSF